MSKCDRKDTTVCSFDKGSPKITAFDIHEWIYSTLHLGADDVTNLQIDGPRRQVFIKVKQNKTIEDLMQSTKDESTYIHDTGEISKVGITQAGLGRRTVRIANLPPEMPADSIRRHMTKYGTVHTMQEEKWTNIYRYKVGNGVRTIHMDLQSHVPSHIHIEGHRALVTYLGQPLTCYICNGTSHIAIECPTRTNKRPATTKRQGPTWANVVDSEPTVPIQQDSPNGETDSQHQRPRNNTDTRQNRSDNQECVDTNTQYRQQGPEERDPRPLEPTHTQTMHGNTHGDYEMDELKHDDDEEVMEAQDTSETIRDDQQHGDTDIEEPSTKLDRTDSDQEETIHSIRIEGIKMEKRITSAEEREIITGSGEDFPPIVPKHEDEPHKPRPANVKIKETTTRYRTVG